MVRGGPEVRFHEGFHEVMLLGMSPELIGWIHWGHDLGFGPWPCGAEQKLTSGNQSEGFDAPRKIPNVGGPGFDSLLLVLHKVDWWQPPG